MGGIRTYKAFEKERRFKGVKISHQITYHHLQHQSEGGPTTIANGANIEEIVHQYIHSLPREQEEIINNMLREFKLNYLVTTGQMEILDCGSFELTNPTDFITIPVYNYNKEQKRKRLKNPTRAMKKREFRKEIENELFEE